MARPDRSGCDNHRSQLQQEHRHYTGQLRNGTNKYPKKDGEREYDALWPSTMPFKMDKKAYTAEGWRMRFMSERWTYNKALHAMEAPPHLLPYGTTGTPLNNQTEVRRGFRPGTGPSSSHAPTKPKARKVIVGSSTTTVVAPASDPASDPAPPGKPAQDPPRFRGRPSQYCSPRPTNCTPGLCCCSDGTKWGGWEGSSLPGCVPGKLSGVGRWSEGCIF